MGAQLEANLHLSSRAEAGQPTRLRVRGMTCGNCARHVAEAAQSVPGVQTASADADTGELSIRWAPGQPGDEGALFRAIRAAGYDPAPVPAGDSILAVDGMTCSNCVRHVTQALQQVPGVAGAEVQLDGGRAVVHWAPGQEADGSALIEAVQNAGYKATLAGDENVRMGSGTRWSPLRGWQFNVAVGLVLTVPLFVCEWVLGVAMEPWYRWLAFALVLPVQVLCGARFYRGAWNQLKVGSSNMDTLVVLGSTTAFVYSAWALFSGAVGHLFFMESASIITLISVGHWLEAKVSARAASSLRSLLNLAPPTARRLDPGGAEIDVPVATLRTGDQVVIKPGDRIPIDAAVLEGASAVDESMLTGESAPVNKARGAAVYGGTTNLHGWLLARVTATGDATALAQIIAVVQRAQTSRANIQRLGDLVSSVFVPIVVCVALATALWWGFAPASAAALSGWLAPWLWPVHPMSSALANAIYHAAAVLIIACPCAMGLATPVAIMAAANVAAERGLLIRDGAALEKTGHITAILFDKTGTITHGRLALLDSEDYLDGEARTVGLHKIAASIAKPSRHPLSQAVAALSAVHLTPTDWREVRGDGVEGRLDLKDPSLQNAVFRLGSLTWLTQSGVDLKPAQAFADDCARRGATVLGLAADGRLLGLLALRDTIKEHAGDVVQALGRAGHGVYLVTGDNATTAAAIAEQVGIPVSHVFAQVRPEAKADLVVQLQGRGERVAFVGDGLNDAPALEQADLGIAVARASDVAREAADLILLNSDIQAVPEALALAQAALRTIKQNLFWAFFYNAIGIPLAALGFLSPIFSAFAMGASDMVVIGNALRLRRWKGPAVGRRKR